MLKRLLSDAAIYTTANVLSRAVVFVLLPIYARTLQPYEIGLLDLTMAIGAILNLLLPLEISIAFARFSAEHPPGSLERNTIATTTWVSLLATSIMGLLVLYFLPLEKASNSQAYTHLMQIKPLAFILWLSLILQYMIQNQLRWDGRARAYGVLGVATAITTVLLGYWLVFLRGEGLPGALVAAIGGMLVSSLLGFVFIRSSLCELPSLQLWRKMLQFSLPLLGGNLILVLAQNADRFLLASLLGLDALGAYGVATRLSSVVSIMLTGIQMAVVPMVFAEHKDKKTKEMLRHAISLFALASASIVVILGTLSSEIVILIASNRYAHVSSLLPIQALSIVVFGANIFFPGLWIDKKSKQIAFLSAFYGISVLVFSGLGAWLWGIIGVAIGSLCASSLYLILVYKVSQRRYKVPLDKAPIVTVFVVVLAVFVQALLAGSLFTRISIMLVLLSILVFTALNHLKLSFARKNI